MPFLQRSKSSCVKLSSSSCLCNGIPCLAKYYKGSITLIKNFPSFVLFLAASMFVVSITVLHVLTVVWIESYSMTLGIWKLIKRFNALLPIGKEFCCKLGVLPLFSITLFRIGLFGAAHGWEGGTKRPHPP